MSKIVELQERLENKARTELKKEIDNLFKDVEKKVGFLDIKIVFKQPQLIDGKQVQIDQIKTFPAKDLIGIIKAQIFERDKDSAANSAVEEFLNEIESLKAKVYDLENNN